MQLGSFPSRWHIPCINYENNIINLMWYILIAIKEKACFHLERNYIIYFSLHSKFINYVISCLSAKLDNFINNSYNLFSIFLCSHLQPIHIRITSTECSSILNHSVTLYKTLPFGSSCHRLTSHTSFHGNQEGIDRNICRCRRLWCIHHCSDI